MKINDSDKKLLSVVIPTLNPDNRFLELLEKLIQNGYTQILVVDDGSDVKKYGKYFSVANDLHAGITVITHEYNKGKGRALKTAFAYIQEHSSDIQYIITIDSDGQHRIEDLEKCYHAMIENPDALVFGCRDFYSDTNHIPSKSKYGNQLTQSLLESTYGITLTDTQTGLRGCKKEIIFSFLETKASCIL